MHSACLLPVWVKCIVVGLPGCLFGWRAWSCRSACLLACFGLFSDTVSCSWCWRWTWHEANSGLKFLIIGPLPPKRLGSKFVPPHSEATSRVNNLNPSLWCWAQLHAWLTGFSKWRNRRLELIRKDAFVLVIPVKLTEMPNNLLQRKVPDELLKDI